MRFWQRISHLIQADDLVIAESGTSSAGISGLRLPTGVTCITQPIWGSIGFTLPALLGSLLAAPTRRQLLFIGDGSLQMTVQELSTLLAHDLKPVIFLINNDGYTIERLILGEHSSYNDINPWRYAQLTRVLDTRERSRTFTVHTEEQLESALAEAEQADSLVFIEVVMERMDGARVTGPQIAWNKAFTAAGHKRSTHLFNTAPNGPALPGNEAFGIQWSFEGKFAVFVGGFPIVVNGEVVGGVGLSGGNGEQDTACGLAALQALKDALAASGHEVMVQADIKK